MVELRKRIKRGCGCDHFEVEPSVAEVIEWLGAVVVPWCAEHDSKMLADLGASRMCQKMFYGDPHYDCRLEEPARHYKIGES